ncbi:MAG: hypothetical protein C5B43_04220 [Verrucomicrobia bacterium]|nr:MAG: hypothetical protein C5B43_04220 [Verrucomicrobiota bacterium]
MNSKINKNSNSNNIQRTGLGDFQDGQTGSKGNIEIGEESSNWTLNNKNLKEVLEAQAKGERESKRVVNSIEIDLTGIREYEDIEAALKLIFNDEYCNNEAIEEIKLKCGHKIEKSSFDFSRFKNLNKIEIFGSFESLHVILSRLKIDNFYVEEIGNLGITLNEGEINALKIERSYRSEICVHIGDINQSLIKSINIGEVNGITELIGRGRAKLLIDSINVGIVATQGHISLFTPIKKIKVSNHCNGGELSLAPMRKTNVEKDRYGHIIGDHKLFKESEKEESIERNPNWENYAEAIEIIEIEKLASHSTVRILKLLESKLIIPEGIKKNFRIDLVEKPLSLVTNEIRGGSLGLGYRDVSNSLTNKKLWNSFTFGRMSLAITFIVALIAIFSFRRTD